MSKRKKGRTAIPHGQKSMLSFFSSSSSPPSERPDVANDDDSGSPMSAEPVCVAAAELEVSTATTTSRPQDNPRKDTSVKDKPAPEETDVKPKVKKKFAQKWLGEFDWLVYDPIRNLMYCKKCLAANKKNAFTSGTSNFRLQTMEIHAGIDDHTAAVEAENLRPNNVRAVVNRMMGDREEAVIAALRNVYYLAKENIATDKYRSLNNLCEIQGCRVLAALRVSENATYTHWDTVTDMQQAISDVLREDLLAKVATSKYIGTMTDESTDISVEKLLLTYINLLTPNGQVETHYLCNTQVTDCDAQSITTVFKDQLARHEIDLNSVTGMCTDGAAVMVGRTNGVVARLKAENPIITGTHCAPHKLNLAAQQAAKNFPSLQRYQRLVGSIYGYFSNSASRQARLKEMTDILETDSVKLKSIQRSGG